MSRNLLEIAALFTKLGVIGFGGPAVHIATMEEEVVHRRKWLTHEEFLDLLAATNLIPGPNSTEMAIHIGYLRGGVPGLVVAGSCFILPAVLITGMFAWLYVAYGKLAVSKSIMNGIQPAVLGIIFSASWRLGNKALKTKLLFAVGLTVAVLAALNLGEVVSLLIGSTAGALIILWKRRSETATGAVLPLALLTDRIAPSTGPALGSSAKTATLAASAAASLSLTKLGLFFLKIGCVLYGGGYVLLAYLQGGLQPGGALEGHLTNQQLLDAIAIGQFTPGPILSTSTFIGYLIAGKSGAVVATLAIFTPSFVLVLLVNPIIPRLRKSPLTSAFLDSVAAGSIGLLGLVTLRLVLIAFYDASGEQIQWLNLMIAVAASLLIFRYKVAPAWIVLGGGLIGFFLL